VADADADFARVSFSNTKSGSAKSYDATDACAGNHPQRLSTISRNYSAVFRRLSRRAKRPVLVGLGASPGSDPGRLNGLTGSASAMNPGPKPVGEARSNGLSVIGHCEPALTVLASRPFGKAR